ncbi:rhodanese-like domain-containing protein [Chengkuizengella sediminis]|uniref:rhodanese-like domain-containing protein n=1 Tax=Chengkuizengella sediminis TaxID=1885917 RepID=UPI003B82E136
MFQFEVGGLLLGIDKYKKIVFVFHTGSMGENSSQFLINNGYMNVSNLTGGMAKWPGPIS